MITTLKTSSGFVYAYVVWSIVDENGHPNNNGSYIYITDMWVHEQSRNNGIIQELILLIDLDDRTKKAYSGMYWDRDINNKEVIKFHSREKLVRFARKDIRQCVESLV